MRREKTSLKEKERVDSHNDSKLVLSDEEEPEREERERDADDAKIFAPDTNAFAPCARPHLLCVSFMDTDTITFTRIRCMNPTHNARTIHVRTRKHIYKERRVYFPQTVLETGQFSDVSLVCGPKTYRCHRLILAHRHVPPRLYRADSMPQCASVVCVSDLT